MGERARHDPDPDHRALLITTLTALILVGLVANALIPLLLADDIEAIVHNLVTPG